MSPDERRTRFADEIRGDFARIEKVVSDLEEAAKSLTPECPTVIRQGVAGLLHSFYTGCESVLARIARATGTMPDGPNWHHALLIGSVAPVPGVRPPVLSAETASLLKLLLDFRHFFRVSYGVDLEVDRLAEHAASVPDAFRRFRDEIEAFLRLVETG